MDLVRALRLSDTPCLALVGAGGKTTALFQLARRLSTGSETGGSERKRAVRAEDEEPASQRSSLPVIVTATTHLHVNQIKLADSHWVGVNPPSLAALEDHLFGVILVTGPQVGDRTTGLDEPTISWLREICGYHDIPLLIEADGSRQHPLKAPAAHEPPIPPFVDLVVVIAGLSALGKPLKGEFVHRPEIFSNLSGLPLNASITSEALFRFLSHPAGGLKNIPPRARKVVLLNQADTPELQAQGKALTHSLIPTYDSVIIASLAPPSPETSPARIHAVYEPAAGIILAAGEAKRFGTPKQLLDYGGKPFVLHIAQTALAAGLSPVVVVTGAHADRVEAVLDDVPVKIARNGAWQSGQSSSIRAGLDLLPANTGSCLFLLADQPQVSAPVINALIERHRQELPPVVAPLVAGQRANPVLFDRITFPALRTLTGDVGGRAIFSEYPPLYLTWHDEGLLVDIDTPADWKKFQGNG